MAVRRTAGVIVKLAAASLAVGLVLSLLEVRPAALLGRLGTLAGDAFGLVVAAVQWAVPYVLLGAVVVLPLWLLLWAVRRLRGR
jgi:hypothetical protein